MPVFCQEEQIKSEIDDIFEFLRKFYGLLVPWFELRVSTWNSEKFMGKVEVWDRGEAMLN
jgi:threonyl-tRNA synthetase